MDLQYLLDLEEIKQLKYSFLWSMDKSEPDDLADLFTLDGVVDAGTYGLMEGQDKIRRGYGKWWKELEPFSSFHIVTNPRITVDGDDARGIWYVLDCGLSNDSTPIKIIGIYDEDYRRVDGVWKLARLKFEYLWSAEKGRITQDNPMQMLTQNS